MKDKASKTNVATINTFWKRNAFHDFTIKSIRYLNRRSIFTVGDYYFILLNAQFSEMCQTPCVWLYEKFEQDNLLWKLTVQTDSGKISASFQDLRLIKCDDMRILVPSIDQ